MLQDCPVYPSDTHSSANVDGDFLPNRVFDKRASGDSIRQKKGSKDRSHGSLSQENKLKLAAPFSTSAVKAPG